MAEFIASEALLYAALGGILPTILWLWFWLHEDAKNPEPKKMIFVTFIAGMIAVPIAIFFEVLLGNFFFDNLKLSESVLPKILIWALIEEFVKYAVVAFGAFRTRDFDEPIDAVVYMITAALGFAALENTLYLIGIYEGGNIYEFLATGNSRFLGSTLLHTVSSGFLGASIGLFFYRKKKWVRPLAVLIGLTTATLLHVAYNFLIIVGKGENVAEVFFALWVVAILAMFVFEKVRKAQP